MISVASHTLIEMIREFLPFGCRSGIYNCTRKKIRLRDRENQEFNKLN